MSDQTPEAAIEASEPSMEDILASIRKIIADDDAPTSLVPETMVLAEDAESFGNVSNLVAPQNSQTGNPAIDPGIEHFVSDGEGRDVELPEALTSDALTSGEALEPADIMDSLMADTPVEAEVADIQSVAPTAIVAPLEAAELDLAQSDLTQLDLAQPDLDVDMMDFDLEAELEGLVDLEIPTPDPTETLEVVVNQTDEIVTRPGMAAKSAAAATGLAAVGAGMLGGLKDKAPEIEELAATDLDDIDADLTALLDTSLTLDDTALDDEIANAPVEMAALADNIVKPAEAPFQTLEQSLDLTETDALDADLTALLDDVMVEDDATSSIDTPELDDVMASDGASVSDDELDSLLEDMNFDAEVTADETIIGEDVEHVAELEASEEDADLLLVKSLMADLADYNTSDDADINSEANLTQDASDLDTSDLDVEALASLDDLLDTDDVVSEPETDEAEFLSDIPDDLEDDEAAILDEILDMTLEDELKSGAQMNDLNALNNADDVATLELENIAENSDIDAMLSDLTPSTDFDVAETLTAETPHLEQNEVQSNESMSLADIAAAAQADAEATNTLVTNKAEPENVGHGKVGLGAVMAGIAAAGGTVVMQNRDNDVSDLHELELTQFDESDAAQEDDVEAILSKLLADEPEQSVQPDESIPEDEVFDLEIFAEDADEAPVISEIEHIAEATDASESHNLSATIEESIDMPRAAAKNTDVIMDDVTEAATSSVFAELNQVVEEKAIVAERGDRVGDLVMEALRPMLKDWLDANLKGIVERAVTKEVKRISSGK